MEEHEVGELRRVKHLANRPADVLVQEVVARVDERRALVVDQELVERDPVGLRERRDPLAAARDVVDPRLHRSS